MSAGKEQTIRAAAELSAGDEIEAWHNGRLFHRGPVLRVLPSVGLFWIQDGQTGTRRLLDVEALEVFRVKAGRGTAGSRGTPATDASGVETPGRTPGVKMPGAAAGTLWFSSSS